MIARLFALCSLMLLAASPAQAGETLYSGIELPDEWPPRPEASARDKPLTPPWLGDPSAVIPIDVGRQLFADDFPIERTENLTRSLHQPEWHADNPIFKAETLRENHRARDFSMA